MVDLPAVAEQKHLLASHQIDVSAIPLAVPSSDRSVYLASADPFSMDPELGFYRAFELANTADGEGESATPASDASNEVPQHGSPPNDADFADDQPAEPSLTSVSSYGPGAHAYRISEAIPAVVVAGVVLARRRRRNLEANDALVLHRPSVDG